MNLLELVQRKYYLLYPKKDDDLWDKLDLRLAWIRENTAGDPDKEARCVLIVPLPI
jgi:hypothetical protein